MLGDERRMGEPWPAPIRVLLELLVDELHHHPDASSIGYFRVDASRREERILAARIELQYRAQPANQTSIVEIAVRQRVRAAQIESLQVEHCEASGRFRLIEARQ